MEFSSSKLLLHKFTWTLETNTTEREALQLLALETTLNLNSIKDDDGWTLLHHACYRGWLEVVRVLIHHHNVEADCKNNFYSTPLHWSAFGGHTDIVRYLVDDLRCNPNSENKRGNTPLQIACWRGHLEVVKFFVLQCKCNPLKANRDGLTPLYEALVCNHLHIFSFLLSTGLVDSHVAQLQIPELLSDWYRGLFQSIIDFRTANPLKPTLKVFVLGDVGAGKTTLVSSLQKYLCSSKIQCLGGRYFRIPEVTPHTAGINQVYVRSKRSGPMALFDFAGHQEFYSSHAALLENFQSPKGAVLVIAIDLTRKNSELVTSLQSWMSFLNSIYDSSRPPTIVVGSHSDILKKAGSTIPCDKLHSVCKASGYLEWDQNCLLVTMNCTKWSSHALAALCNRLHQHLEAYHMTFDVDAQTHVINAIIKEHFKFSDACQVHEVMGLLRRQSEGLFKYGVLPSLTDHLTISQIFSQLNNLGEFVYLESDNYIEGWIVFNKQLLFAEVNGTIFAHEKFCLHYDISNSTGIVPKHKLQTVFRKYNIDMISKFLLHFKYCSKISDNDAARSQDELYFFPQLVRQTKPDLNYFASCVYTCVWQLKCSKVYQCFTSRCTERIVTQLATLFGLSPEESTPCPVISKECNVWNLGIHWKDMDGVEVVVEFSENYKSIFLRMGCQRECELHLVRLRSNIIKIIQQIKIAHSKGVEVHESFLYNKYEFSTSRMYQAAIGGNKFVTCRRGVNIEQILLNDLLFLEPLSLIPFKLVKKICDVRYANRDVDLYLFEELKYALSQDRTGFSNLVFQPCLKYMHLKELLFSHSIFHSSKVCNDVVEHPVNEVEHEVKHEVDVVEHLLNEESGNLSMKELELLRRGGGQELRIIDLVAAEWEQVAIQIGFQPSEIRLLERDYANDARRACWKVFNEWLCRGQDQGLGQDQDIRPPTWASLYDVLVQLNYDYAAQQMREIRTQHHSD